MGQPRGNAMLRLAGLSSCLFFLGATMAQEIVPDPPEPAEDYRHDLLTDERRTVVTDQAMGARCAVAADFDGDGLMDLVAASSNDNAVSWFRNEGLGADGLPTFSIKKQITWSSLGSRIVTVADIDADGDVDVVGASYYDSSLRWFENDGTGVFTSHLISTGVNEGQGVTVADVDNDGTVDVISASSGDNTVAVFRNLDGNGTFCEIKEVVDDDAIGARTAVAADFNGDGWVDIASASKDDDTVAWYPNDGTGRFPTKIIVSKGNYSSGAYSLVARDVDGDGTQDLVVASNGNDAVTLWRNDGSGNFTRTLIYDQADFVLSVTAVDFDRDGDVDVASASFFDGRIIWYENLDGKGYNWTNHTVYVGLQGHYVSHADMDGDGDDDLIAVTHAENTVAVYLARTGCDLDMNDTAANVTAFDGNARQPECCRLGTEWNAATMACEPCPFGEYGVGGTGVDAQCAACPTDTCTIDGLFVLPTTCSGVTGCADVEASVAACSCPADTVRDATTDACAACPEGQVRPDNPEHPVRTADTLANYSLWERQQGTCAIDREESGSNDAVLIGVIVALVVVVIAAAAVVLYFKKKGKEEDDVWLVRPSELKFSDPPQILGRGTFGLVVLAEYRGTEVAVKRVIPPRAKARVTDSVIAKHPSTLFSRRSSTGTRRSSNGNGSGGVQVLRRISSRGEDASEQERRDSYQSSTEKRVSSVFDESDDLALPDVEKPVAESGTQTVVLKSVVLKSGKGPLHNGRDSLFEAFSNQTNKACDVATHAKLVLDFQEEMRHLSKLRHPCITTVMGAVVEANAEPALVMEYMDRGSLYDILHNETVALDGDVLLPILQDICQGLRFLHGADPPVIHGDLKSANVLIDSKSRAKIADFGLTQKKEIGVAGTPFWMSPELLRGESGNTTASDVYSFGIILYEVYSRKDPYEGEGSFRTILTQICDPTIQKRPPTPSSCPDTIGVIMRECLDGDPTARPSSEELDLRLRRERVENVEPGDMHLTVQSKNKADRMRRGDSIINEMFPPHIADALREGRKVEPEHHECVTVFFSDIVRFTEISQELGHRKCARMLDQLYTRFDELSEKHSVFKIEVIGDAYLAVTNLVKDQKEDHVKRLAEFAIDAVQAASELPLDEEDPVMGYVQIRVGLHSGPVIADVLGTRLPKYSIFGDTVNTASRMESSSLAGRIQCSSTTANLLSTQAPGIPQSSRGTIDVKGKGEMHCFWVNEEP